MFLSPFHQATPAGIRISPQQASRFAKEVAGDFNPIHDPDAKRFCVPGDLLFSLALDRYGLHRRMGFSFSGMVGPDVTLIFPEGDEERFAIADAKGKKYLQVERAEERTLDRELIEAFARAYVAFSGRNFPYILVPLMAERQVMLNPDRPLVIYESMSFDLDRLDFSQPRLELAASRLEVQGRRGDVWLEFHVLAEAGKIGTGRKKLVLSGLQPYDAARVQGLVEALLARQHKYLPA
ncbi:MAG: DUF3581 domain-containing protein [Gammaproteobacteria bacterium]|nr:DUF3581 domain-containing protein [Gammaproteobacteria bacterium]MBU1654198.1 DUF3581 domain-containing protein [Gammaproteobacteria bacterium]MBU1960858.1 DUF3581 domain-containing protein [Gammaproteobacteria bacterium]